MTRALTGDSIKAIMMQHIWKGDITEIRDIREFQLILENTHTWAMRVFKLQISVFIDQWRAAHCSTEPDSTNAAIARHDETMELSRGTLSMIQHWPDRESSFELDDRPHTPLTPTMMGILIQKICAAERKILTEDMDRLLTEKINELAVGNRESAPPGLSLRSERLQARLDSEETQQASHVTVVDSDDFEDHSSADRESLNPGSTDCTLRNNIRRSSRLRETAASQPGTPSSGQITQASGANASAGTKAVLGKAPKSPKTPKIPKIPKTPEARKGRALPPALAIEISSGSGSSEDSDAGDVEDNPAYSPSSTCSTFFTASEGRSVQGSMDPPSTRGSIVPPLSIRSSMGPPSWRTPMNPPSVPSSRDPPSVCSSVDPLLDSANIGDWGYPPQQNVRKVYPDTCPRCQRARRFFHNCHV
ncbi:hypothetical protein NW762_009041 [Fusarium torreyae]|uniref:Uncharacterized protein n=1 Tax=Fusarium torreyae TaxID=1237075 RepID=A0A9W8VBV4_9HYPO|nr:hypothetical protein NW762_009041 [Fusarium torreyae]